MNGKIGFFLNFHGFKGYQIIDSIIRYDQKFLFQLHTLTVFSVITFKLQKKNKTNSVFNGTQNVPVYFTFY